MGENLRTRIASAPDAALGVLVFLVCLIAYVPSVTSTYVNTDAGANSLAAWRFAHTGSPWMDGLDLRETGKVSHFGVGRDGHMVTTRTPGQIWAAAPFYLGSSDSQRNWSFHRGGIAAAVLTATAVALMFLGLSRAGASRPLALGATAVFGLASPVWSVSANALWTHPVTLLGICGAVWAQSRDRWWWAGVWFAVGMTGRMHVAVIAALVGVGMAWSRRSPRIAVQIAIPTLIALGLLSAWSLFVYGSLDPRGSYADRQVENMVPAIGQGISGFAVNLAGFLFSPDRGLFVWTPVLLLLVPAVVRGWRRAPDWTRWLVVGGAAYSTAQVGINVFHGGDVIFGYRLGLEMLATATPLYVCCAPLAGNVARFLAPMVVGLQAGAFFLGSVLESISLPESEVWRANAIVTAFVNRPTSLGVVFVLVACLCAVATQVLLTRGGGRISEPVGAPVAGTAGPRTGRGSRATR